MGGGGDVSRGGNGNEFLGLGGSGGGLPAGNEENEDVTGTCGNMTGILMGSTSRRLESLSLGLVWKLGVTGVLAGDCLNTATGDPKLGLARGDTLSSLLGLLPIFGRGLGWFFPGKPLGLIPGDFRLSPGHLLSLFRFFIVLVLELLGSISSDRDQR